MHRLARIKRSHFGTATLAAILSLGGLSAMATAAPVPVDAANPWATMARNDIAFSTQWIEKQSILAVYPDPAGFHKTLAAAQRSAASDIEQVTTFEGYRETMQHFAMVFNDAHLRANIQLSQTHFAWPGFLAAYRGHQYVVVETAGPLGGQVITSCDSKPVDTWINEIAPYAGVIGGLDSTRANAAPMLFRDAGSPFIKRPDHCVIGGKDVSLSWSDIGLTKLSESMNRLRAPADRHPKITAFGDDGAWVRLGIFQMNTKEEADAFREVVRLAPTLRNKAFIVVDVRGNGGGPYNWFMAFLRGLYGDDYSNYHARARLQIAAVYRVTPEALPHDDDLQLKKAKSLPDPLAEPPDGIPYDPDNALYAKALAHGDSLLHSPRNKNQIPLPDHDPVNPVKARVLVLTDYNCGSACIGFVDEAKRFPNVTQIGTETFVDSRTGTPMTAPLPSGSGNISVPHMTRDGRERGDNEPQKPSIEYPGDIMDTDAVKQWILHDVLHRANAG